MRIIRHRYGRWLLVVPIVLLSACGKKGPPLAPLVYVPEPVTELEVQRQGDAVQVGFILPVRNQDNTEPADLVRMEVYAMTTQPRMPPDRTLDLEEFMEAATPLETIEVELPIPPLAVVSPEPGSPSPGVLSLDGPVPQGAAVTVSEPLTPETQVPVDPWKDEREEEEEEEDDEATQPVDRPLMNLVPIPLQREYVVVSVTSQGTEIEAPTRIAVPLGIRVPEPPPAPTVEYTASVIDVTWEPPPGVCETVQSTDTDPPSEASPTGSITPPSASTPEVSGSVPLTPGPAASPLIDTSAAP
ncbi:MAG: hypothetical protein VYE68_03425, partial [Acidobacteriota bacterium]|nr:hypothetical protein [Acidobacteriota bacterium]